MCGPAALIIASTAMSAIGTGVGAIKQSQEAHYEAAVADSNAQNQIAAAKDARDRGEIDLKNQYQQASQLKGAQIASMSANGIDVGFGSALAVQQAQAQLTQEDALTTSHNTDETIRGYEINAANYDAQAAADKQKASGALIQGAFGVGSTILNGATQYSKYKSNPNGWGSS